MMCLSGSGQGQSGDEAQGGLVMPAAAERSGRAVPELAVVRGAGEHVPDGPPLGQQPSEAVSWPRPSVKAKAST